MADEPDIEKARKKKPRHKEPKAEVYLSNAHEWPSPEQVRATMAELAADEDDDQADANAARAGVGKGTAGNPAPHPAGGTWTDRVSPSRATGQGSPSSGDHGAWQDPMNAPGPRALALGHPSMRQSTTTPFPLSMMQTFNGDNQFGDKDLTLGGGRVSLQRLDAAAASGLDSAPGNPVSRRMPHSAPIGANNGTHSLAQPEGRHPMSMKNSERQQLMKNMLFPGSGGRR